MVKKAVETRHRDKKFPDRIYRGRILKLARESGRIPIADIGPKIDASYVVSRDAEWVTAMVGRLEKDGMIRRVGSAIVLAQ